MTDSLRNRPQGTGAIWGFATRVSDDAEGIVALRGSAMISLRDVVISLAIRSPNLGLAVRRRMSQTFFQATYMKDSVLETVSTATSLVLRGKRERQDCLYLSLVSYAVVFASS